MTLNVTNLAQGYYIQRTFWAIAFMVVMVSGSCLAVATGMCRDMWQFVSSDCIHYSNLCLAFFAIPSPVAFASSLALFSLLVAPYSGNGLLAMFLVVLPLVDTLGVPNILALAIDAPGFVRARSTLPIMQVIPICATAKVRHWLGCRTRRTKLCSHLYRSFLLEYRI